MKMYCCKTQHGLSPCWECDYDNFKSLKENGIYAVDVKTERNIKFHRKYMAFFNKAWECLPESHSNFFHNNIDGFRKTVEIASGYYEPVYNLEKREWQHQAKSIAFGKLEEKEFEELYERVKDVVFRIFLKHISEEEFFEKLGGF